jgi:molecular chaperone GrpE
MQDQEDKVLPSSQSEATSEAQSSPTELLLQGQLAASEARLLEMQDAYLRAKADSENIRRRALEDITKARKFSIENFAEAMVPVRDSLEMALIADTTSIDSLKEGVDMTLKQLISAFEKNHLVEILPIRGEKIDPMRHQAVATLPSEQESNTVISVLQKGYMIADRLLRPAIVTATEAK